MAGEAAAVPAHAAAVNHVVAQQIAAVAVRAALIAVGPLTALAELSGEATSRTRAAPSGTEHRDERDRRERERDPA